MLSASLSIIVREGKILGPRNVDDKSRTTSQQKVSKNKKFMHVNFSNVHRIFHEKILSESINLIHDDIKLVFLNSIIRNWLGGLPQVIISLRIYLKNIEIVRVRVLW